MAATGRSSAARNVSEMRLDDLEDRNDEISLIQSETQDYLTRIHETKVELNVLMLKTHSYARNTSMSYKDVLPPKAEGAASYSRSPFGRKLLISDYSSSLAPTTVKWRKSKT
jgi:hypothetical protein